MKQENRAITTHIVNNFQGGKVLQEKYNCNKSSIINYTFSLLS